mgnify:CR=1 FL=1
MLAIRLFGLALAAELGVEIEIFHSNIEGEVINRLYDANDQGFDAALFNPALYPGVGEILRITQQPLLPLSPAYVPRLENRAFWRC